MQTIARRASGVEVRVEIPNDWHVRDKPVPKLAVPQQLFAVANNGIPEVKSAERHFPDVGKMPQGSLLVWVCLQVPGYPTPNNTVKVEFDGNSAPLDYKGGTCFAPYQREGWTTRDYIWRRTGLRVGNKSVLVWIWESLRASGTESLALGKVVASIRASQA
jgi:hypothetical protein